MTSYTNPTPRTQKARSIVALSKGLGSGSTPPYWLAQDEESLVKAYNLCKQAGFVPFGRPCPTLPRPGFYESCELQSEEHAREMWRGTMALDSMAEVLVMPWQQPELSATWTPGLLGVGPGNDGATAGINSIAIPVAPFAEKDSHGYNVAWRNMVNDAGVMEHPDEAQRNPHLETVYKYRFSNEFRTMYVQLRAGAAAAGAGDYIPRPTKVTQIVKADHDYTDPEAMIKWEATTKALAKNPEGVLVWHPGGTQGTHTALHCKNNGLAVTMQEEEPQIGDFFESTDKPLPIDIDEVLRYASAALTIPMSRKKSVKGVLTPAQALDLMLVLTHGYRPSGKEARWIGAAAAFMLRLGAAALLGERRHAGGRARSRTQIHESAFSNWFTARGKITEAAYKFANHKWPGGFGGKAWLECTMALAELDGYLVQLASKRDQESLQALVGALNNTLNKAHNNGWWMNKFGEKQSMDMAAAGNPTIALRCAPFAYQLHEWVKVDKELVAGTVLRLRKSRRLRCLSDDALVPKPPTTKIKVDTVHFDIKGDGTRQGSAVHFQFYTEDKGNYHTHDVKGVQFTSAEWTKIKDYFQSSTKSDNSYAGSSTVYKYPESIVAKNNARLIEVTLCSGTQMIPIEVGKTVKGLPVGNQNSIGAGVPSQPVFNPPQAFNESDYYAEECDCSECVEFFKANPQYTKAAQEAAALEAAAASATEEDSAPSNPFVGEDEQDAYYCDACDDWHDSEEWD